MPCWKQWSLEGCIRPDFGKSAIGCVALLIPVNFFSFFFFSKSIHLLSDVLIIKLFLIFLTFLYLDIHFPFEQLNNDIIVSFDLVIAWWTTIRIRNLKLCFLFLTSLIGFWWIILLRTYWKLAGACTTREDGCTTGIRLILILCSIDRFDMFPTLLVTDSSSRNPCNLSFINWGFLRFPSCLFSIC